MPLTFFLLVLNAGNGEMIYVYTIITILIIIPATPFPTFRTSEFLNQHMLV